MALPRKSIALVEFCIGVIPVAMMWLLLAPGMAVLLFLGYWVEHGRPGISTLAAFWLIGGGAGTLGLGRVLTRQMRVDHDHARPRAWEAACLALGILVSGSVAILWSRHALGFQFPSSAIVIVLLPVPIALRHLLRLG